MEMKKMTMRFTGSSPLLFNNGLQVKLVDPGPKPGPKKKRDPEAEAEASCYRNKGGLYFLPTAFRASLVAAAKGLKVGMVGLPGIIKGSVFTVGTDCTPLFHPQSDDRLTKYEILQARVVNHNTHPPAALVSFRPYVRDWRCDVVFEINDGFMPQLDALMDLWERAGMSIGVGCWRPEKCGSYGRFVAEILERDKSPIWDEPKSSKKVT